MKRFGIQFLAEAANGFWLVACRFPLAIIAAGIFVVTLGFYEDEKEIIISAGVAIPLFILAGLLGEGLERGKRARWAPSAVGLIFVTWYGLSVGERLYTSFATQLAMILLAVHLAIAFLPPLIAKLPDAATWEYNKTLLASFLIAAFYSAVFFIGTALALQSINFLFDIDIRNKTYQRLWYFCAFFLNTALFLGRIPRLAALKTVEVDCPTWIRFLSKFILLPLVVIYFGILYAYLIKVGLSWSWPNGMVGYPVFILSVIGGLTALLMWPLTKKPLETPWAKKLWQWYFPLVIPLSIVLLLALHKRIGEYGYTELRYGGLILAAWLLAVCIFYTISRKASFKVIPISLCGLVIICLFGPLSPSHVGERSQWNRLSDLLEEEGWLSENALVSNPHAIATERYDQMVSMIRYLERYYGPRIFSDWIPSSTDKEEKIRQYHNYSDKIVKIIGATRSAPLEGYNYINFYLREGAPYAIENPATLYAFNYNYGSYNKSTVRFHSDGQALTLDADEDEQALTLKTDEDGYRFLIVSESEEELASIEFNEWLAEQNLLTYLDNTMRRHPLEANQLTFNLEWAEGKVVNVIAERINLQRKEANWRISSAKLLVFVPSSN